MRIHFTSSSVLCYHVTAGSSKEEHHKPNLRERDREKERAKGGSESKWAASEEAIFSHKSRSFTKKRQRFEGGVLWTDLAHSNHLEFVRVIRGEQWKMPDDNLSKEVWNSAFGWSYNCCDVIVSNKPGFIGNLVHFSFQRCAVCQDHTS